MRQALNVIFHYIPCLQTSDSLLGANKLSGRNKFLRLALSENPANRTTNSEDLQAADANSSVSGVNR